MKIERKITCSPIYCGPTPLIVMGFIIQVVFCSTELFASESPKHYQGTFIHAAIET